MRASSETYPETEQRSLRCSVLEIDVIKALQVVLAEEGFKLGIEDTINFLLAFEQFSRESARAAWVVVEDKKDDCDVVKTKDEKDMADKGKRKEAGSKAKGEEEIDGNS